MSQNTSHAPSPQPLPKYEWPRPGDDLPRLPWSAYLRLIALQIDIDYPGTVGRFLSAHLIALALQADGLGATDPDSHERLAQEAAEAEAAWQQALLDEVAAPDVWETNESDPGDDEVGGWGGHLEVDEGAQHVWLPLDEDGEAFCN